MSRKTKCAICGQEFIAVSPNRKYCSADCAMEGKLRKRKKWEESNPKYNSDYFHGITKQNKWIPVSERLPESNKHVLCTIEELCTFPDFDQYDVPCTYICQGIYFGDDGWWKNIHPDGWQPAPGVTAWMELPSAYVTSSAERKERYGI